MAAVAQVVAPAELQDPALRDLQGRYLDDLKQAGADILALKFDYPFYLSRKLDLNEAQQKSADQRSLRFERFNNRTVVAVTGNYYAAYSTDKMAREQRARETFLKVVLPVLKATVPHFQNNSNVQGYGLEISHHVLGKVMNVVVERPENLVVYLPQRSALKLLAARDDATQQAALLEGQTMLNAEPVSIWISGQAPSPGASGVPAAHASDDEPTETTADGVPAAPAQGGSAIGYIRPSGSKPAFDPAPALKPPRDTSPEALAKLEVAHKETIAKMLQEMDPQAHFVGYAAPDFYVFRQGIYLELSTTSALSEAAAGSRYRIAAFAFDDHIAHLVRPALGYFKGDQNFDGLAFSTTAKLQSKGNAPAESIEFFFPFDALRCYERYDCTGQQLIDAGTVLINGERVSLDLQVAEGGAGR
jgi:hypothetical protein